MYDIDFVITWLDDSDPVWRAEKAKYNNEEGLNNEVRFRDWDLLKYWFRSVEKYAPWVRTIHLVTYGHIPDWLNTENPKLHIVKHQDYIPSKYLPTFNSHTIELNMHRIPGLADHFVYFNDDVFITRPVSPEFFFENGLPKDLFALRIINYKSDNKNAFKTDDNNSFTYANDVRVINNNFNAREVYKKHWAKLFSPRNGIRKTIRTIRIWSVCRGFFPGFFNPHVHFSFLKSTFEEVWKKEPEVLDKTCMCKFRDPHVNVGPSLMRAWQFVQGNYIPRPGRFTKVRALNNDNIPSVVQSIKEHQYYVLCINDNYQLKSIQEAQAAIADAFENTLPDKSSFEK